MTTVAGNQTIEKTTANALRVLELCGRGDVPVAEGAGDPLVRQRSSPRTCTARAASTGPICRRPPARPVDEHAVELPRPADPGARREG